MFSVLKSIFIRLKQLRRLGQYKNRFPKSEIRSLLPTNWENRIMEYSVIEPNCTLQGDVMFLGKGLYIGSSTLIYNCESIGHFCSISSDVKIGLVQHPKRTLSTSPLFYSSGRGLVEQTTYNGAAGNKVRIGHDVLISANVLVLNGISIGTGAIIGAGAVVTRDVPPYAIVVGVPARIAGYRFDQETIEALLQSEWWNLPLQDILELPYLQNGDTIKERAPKTG